MFGAGAGPLAQVRYLIVYDVPTETDVEASLPITGQAGEVLTDLLDGAHIPLTSCYVTPVLGCRPTVLLPATDDAPERIADREPKKEELEACRPRLDEIIYTVDPMLIFALGDLSWKVLVQPRDRDGHGKLEKAVGNLVLTRIKGKVVPELTYPVIPLFPMKQIIASPSVAPHGTIAVTARHLREGKKKVEYAKKLEAVDQGTSEEPRKV